MLVRNSVQCNQCLRGRNEKMKSLVRGVTDANGIVPDKMGLDYVNSRGGQKVTRKREMSRKLTTREK